MSRPNAVPLGRTSDQTSCAPSPRAETIINTNLGEEEEVKYEESVLLLTLRQLDYLENPRKCQKNRKDFENTFPISSVIIPYPPPQAKWAYKDDVLQEEQGTTTTIINNNQYT